MKTIAVTGGKGGTGKSTFSALYASKLASTGKKAVLYDADVECPNDHLLLGKKLTFGNPLFLPYPKLTLSKCTGCSDCVSACRRNAISIAQGKKPVFVEDLCDACGACFIACKENAIIKKSKEIAKVYTSKVNKNLTLVSGLSAEGLPETSQAVSLVKKHAIKKAKELNADILIVDTAAGLHCSVISALSGAERAFCVTEPTPLGVHDLELSLSLLKKMHIPAEIVLNKKDAGDSSGVESLANSQGLEITQEIPYSKKVIELYSIGKLNNKAGVL